MGCWVYRTEDNGLGWLEEAPGSRRGMDRPMGLVSKEAVLGQGYGQEWWQASSSATLLCSDLTG